MTPLMTAVAGGKHKVVKPLLKAEKRCAYGITEAEAGSDVAGLRTFAERRDLPRAATTALTEATAWHDVIESTALYSGGARKFTWLGPQQVVGNCPVGDRYGSFAFLMESGDGIFFPVI